jgi:hypothetical protein
MVKRVAQLPNSRPKLLSAPSKNALGLESTQSSLDNLDYIHDSLAQYITYSKNNKSKSIFHVFSGGRRFGGCSLEPVTWGMLTSSNPDHAITLHLLQLEVMLDAFRSRLWDSCLTVAKWQGSSSACRK